MNTSLHGEMSTQLALFDLIRLKHDESEDWVAEVQDLLFIENRPLRNRMSGHTLLLLPEFRRLTKHYNISLEEIYQWEQQMPVDKWHPMICSPYQESICPYSKHNLVSKPLLRQEVVTLAQFVDRVLADLEQQHIQRGGWMKVVCSELPWFNILEFEELTYFRMYVFYCDIVRKEMSFERFLDTVRQLNLTSRFRKARAIGQDIPCQEIWERDLMLRFLEMLEECYVCRKFESSDSVILLLDQVDALINNLECFLLVAADRDRRQLELYLLNTRRSEGFVLLGDQEGTNKVVKEVYLLQLLRSENPDVVGLYGGVFDTLLARSYSLLTASNLMKRKFTNTLREQVSEYRERLLDMG